MFKLLLPFLDLQSVGRGLLHLLSSKLILIALLEIFILEKKLE